MTEPLEPRSKAAHASPEVRRRSHPIGRGRPLRALVAAIVSLTVLVTVAAPSVQAQRASNFPAEIELPQGYFPEGIAVGRGSTFYVGSLSDGSVYRGDLRTGEGAVLTNAFGPFSAVGIDVDQRNRVWVAGGPTGTARVHDGDTGELLATYKLTAPFMSFINDVIVTADAAWFTDSGTQNSPDPGAFRFAGSPRVFKVPLGPAGELPDGGAIEEIAVDAPDVTFPNLNGIEIAPWDNGLLVNHTVLGSVFGVDPGSGSATEVYSGLAGADGMSRRGRTLYVVENGAAQIAEIRIDPSTGTGTLARSLPVTGSETPTTSALFGSAIYAVDARFGSMAGPYKVFRVEL